MLIMEKNGKPITLASIILGYVPGAEYVNLRGSVATLTTSARTIWGNGSSYNPPSTAQAMEIVSASTADTSAGNNAQTVLVKGVDGDFAEVEETVSMDGQTAVDLTNTYIGINSLEVATVGSGLVNAGVISCRVDGGGQAHKLIDAASDITGKDYDFIYTVPAGKRLLICDLNISCNKQTDGVTFYLLDYDLTASNTVARSVWSTGIASGDDVVTLPCMTLVPEKHRIDLRAFVDGGTTGRARVTSNCILIDDDVFDPSNLRM